MTGGVSRVNLQTKYEVQLLMLVPRGAIRRNEKSQGDGDGTVESEKLQTHWDNVPGK